MNALIEHIWGVIRNPSRAFRLMMLRNSGAVAVTVFTGVLLSAGIDQYVSNALFKNNFGAFARYFGVESVAIIAILFVFASVFHMTADFLGGAGRGTNMFCFMLIALLPLWLKGPLSYLLLIIIQQPFIEEIVAFLLYLWCFILLTIGIMELYRFSLGKALLTLLIPVMIVSLIASAVTFAGIDWFRELIDQRI